MLKSLAETIEAVLDSVLGAIAQVFRNHGPLFAFVNDHFNEFGILFSSPVASTSISNEILFYRRIVVVAPSFPTLLGFPEVLLLRQPIELSGYEVPLSLLSIFTDINDGRTLLLEAEVRLLPRTIAPSSRWF